MPSGGLLELVRTGAMSIIVALFHCGPVALVATFSWCLLSGANARFW